MDIWENPRVIAWASTFVEALGGMFAHDNGIMGDVRVEEVPHVSGDGYWAMSDGGRRAWVLGDQVRDIGSGCKMVGIDYRQCEAEIEAAYDADPQEEVTGWEYYFKIEVGLWRAGNPMANELPDDDHITIRAWVCLDGEYGQDSFPGYGNKGDLMRNYQERSIKVKNLCRNDPVRLAQKFWGKS